MFRYILVFLLLILPVHANIHYDSLKTFLTKKYFTLTNSVTLNIPFKYAPKFIYDFAISKNYIYMLSESDHPILQFKKNGQFIGSIGKKGNGPEEFMFTPVKIAANKYNDQFIAIDGPGGISLYHYIPGKKIKKYTNTSYFGFVDIEIFKNLPVIVCSSESKKHIKFLGKDFTINESYIDVPVESKILASVSTSFWGIQKNGNQSFLSNVSYPFHIFQSQILKKNNSLEYSNLPVSNNILLDFKAPPYKEEYSIKEYKKYSHLRWLIGNENILLGTFFGYDNKGKSINETFIIKKNKLIQTWHLEIDDILRIIPLGNQLIVFNYIDFENSSNLKISFWKLKEM